MPAIPPAPPLPPTRAPQPSTRSAFARFVTHPFSRTAQASRQDHDSARSAVGLPMNLKNPGINTLSSQDSSLKAPGGAEITSLDINRNRTHAVVAGRDILQTVRVDGSSCIEEENLLAAIINSDRQNANVHRETLDIHDVKWSHGEYSNYIATAASNGKVVIYDLGKPGVEVARLHEHSRQVHKVAFNPFQGYLLLSASQDGTLRFWDLRDFRSEIKTWRSRAKYPGQSDGIRDVRWSPTDGVEFAFGTDGGVVQKWDFRKQSARLRINAHDRYCTSIDWHPDGKHLVSAGQDKYLKVWDMSTESRRSKPLWFIRTPYPVLNARWRCPFLTSDDSQRGPCTQIASSYERQYAVVHVWDLQQPYMPYREICNWTSAPTDMLWHSRRLLWTVGREGHFNQTDVQYSPKVVDRRPMQAMALSPTGEICVFSQRRIRRRSSEVEFYDAIPIPVDEPDMFPERSELSRSAADDPLDDSFLSTSYKKHSSRSQRGLSKSAASTPPSVHDPDLAKAVKLNETMAKKDGSLNRSQTSYRGFLDGTLNALTFSYLSQKYKSIPQGIPESETVMNIRKVFDQNAVYAQRTGSYRVAQTWRVFGALVAHELSQGGFEMSRKIIATSDKLDQKDPKELGSTSREKQRQNLLLASQHPKNRSGRESSSSAPTPPARATKPWNSDQLQPNSLLTNSGMEKITGRPSLGATRSPTRSMMSTPQSLGTLNAATGIFNEPELYLSTTDINARKAQMSNWRATPRIPLDFNVQSTSYTPINSSPRLNRHNSDDSLGMSGSSESQRSAGAILDSYGKSHKPNMSNFQQSFDRDSNDNFILPADAEGMPADAVRPLPDAPKTHFSWLKSSSPTDFGILMPYHTADPEDERNLEASQTVIPDEPIDAALDGALDDASELKEKKTNVRPAPEQPPDGQASAVTTQQMMLQMLEYYTDRIPNAQLVYHVTILVKFLLQDPNKGYDISAHVRDIILAQAPDIVNPLREESILSTYQEQLQGLQIYNSGVALAREAVKDHQYLFDTANSQIGFICMACLKPINNPSTKFRCENCGERQAPCPICWQKYPAFAITKKSRKATTRGSPWLDRSRFAKEESATTDHFLLPKETWSGNHASAADDGPIEASSQTKYPILWQSCLVCGHGAHASCLQHVQNDPRIGGKCPTEGCLCDCIPGPYRALLNREALDEKLRKERGTVRRDSVRASESKAVSRARGLLEGDGRRDTAMVLK